MGETFLFAETIDSQNFNERNTDLQKLKLKQKKYFSV